MSEQKDMVFIVLNDENWRLIGHHKVKVFLGSPKAYGCFSPHYPLFQGLLLCNDEQTTTEDFGNISLAIRAERENGRTTAQVAPQRVRATLRSGVPAEARQSAVKLAGMECGALTRRRYAEATRW